MDNFDPTKKLITKEQLPDIKEVNLVINEYSPELKITPDTWTHLTDSLEFIKHIFKNGFLVSNNEQLEDFNVPQTKGYEITINKSAPYFKKGKLFDGYQSKIYLITTEISDDAFQPNINGRNEDSLTETKGIAVLKPEYRKIDNFRFWKMQDGIYKELIKV